MSSRSHRLCLEWGCVGIAMSCMSGNKCSYVDCHNSARRTPGMRKFYFPIKDQARCREWVLLCGNPSLVGLDDDELKKHFLCDKHFPDEFLDNRKKLPPGALPVDYAQEIPVFINPVLRTYSKHSNNKETEVTSEEANLPVKNTGIKSATPDASTDRTAIPSSKQREIEKMHLPTLQKQPESLEPTRSPSPSIEKSIDFPSSSECERKFDKGKLKRKVPLGSLPMDSSTARTSTSVSVVRTYSKPTTSKKATVSSEETSLPEKSTCCQLLSSDDSANETDSPVKKKKQLEGIDPPTIQKKKLQAANPWEQEYVENVIRGLPSPPNLEENPRPPRSKFFRNVESLPDLPRIIVKMQLNHKPGTPWTPEEEDAAILLYNKSPSMYRFLKESGFILPSEKTVCN